MRAVRSCSAFVKLFRSLLFLCCPLLVSTGMALAAGDYQQTRDGKTMVWNATPKAGDTASWSGARDKENYATGFGDLTWYNASGKELGLFYGNMVRGKFEGPVNLHIKGRTLHAYYADGGRVTGWSRGRAPSNMPVPEEAQRRREAAKQPEPEPTPATKKAKPAAEQITKSEPTPQPSEPASRGPETYSEQRADKPPTVTEKESESPKAEQELKQPEPATSQRGYAEPTPFPKSTVMEAAPAEKVESPKPTVERATTTPSAAPSVEETPPVLHQPLAAEPTRPPTLQSPRSETPADVSVNALVGPPSALRSNVIPEIPTGTTHEETSSSAKPDAPLTESEVIRLVDTEARAQGAPLDEYERPKVDHSAVKGKWTLFYAKKGDANIDLPAFSATVDDKTHKVELRK